MTIAFGIRPEEKKMFKYTVTSNNVFYFQIVGGSVDTSTLDLNGTLESEFPDAREDRQLLNSAASSDHRV